MAAPDEPQDRMSGRSEGYGRPNEITIGLVKASSWSELDGMQPGFTRETASQRAVETSFEGLSIWANLNHHCPVVEENHRSRHRR